MKKTLFPLIIINLILSGQILSAESRGVEFRSPEPYIDYEFEELQRTFLKKRTIQLATLKSLPLNQYPEEFIIELINRIKAETKREVQKDMLKYLSKYLKKNKLDLGPESKTDTLTSDNAFLLNKAAINKYKGSDEKIEFTKKQDTISMKADGEKSDKILDKKPMQYPSAKEEKKADEKMEKYTVEGRGDNSVSFSLNNNNPFLGINSLTRNLMMNIDISANPKNVRYVDVTIYLKNIDTEMIYSLKRFSMVSVSGGKKSFSFLWEYPTINAGKYKPYTTVRFYDAGQRLITSKTQYWGNTNSNQKYIIMKN